MVTKCASRAAREQGSLMTELLVATALLLGALLPLAYSIASERELARAFYQRAVAIEIVDGETEILAAGGWRAFALGTNSYSVRAGSATNLPPGQFWLTIENDRMRLEWKPAVKNHGGGVVREVNLK